VKHPTLVAIQNKSFTVILNLSPIVVILNVVKDPRICRCLFFSSTKRSYTVSKKLNRKEY